MINITIDSIADDFLIHDIINAYNDLSNSNTSGFYSTRFTFPTDVFGETAIKINITRSNKYQADIYTSVAEEMIEEAGLSGAPLMNKSNYLSDHKEEFEGRLNSIFNTKTTASIDTVTEGETIV